MTGTRGGGREVGEASGRKGLEQGESGKGPCKELSPQRLVLQGARLSLNLGAAVDLEFSDSQGQIGPPGRSGERFRPPASCRAQRAQATLLAACGAQGSPQSGPAQHPPPKGWFPSAGEAEAWSSTALCWTPWGTAHRAPSIPSGPWELSPRGLASEVQAGAWLGGGGQERPHLGPGSRQLPPSPHFLFLVPKRL